MSLRPIQRFWRLLELDRKEIVQIYSYAILSGLVSLTLPLGSQSIINFIQSGEINMAWILLVLFITIGIALTGFIQIQQIKIVENIQRNIFVRSAFEFAYRIPKMNLESLDGTYMPELINRFFDTLTLQKGMPKILIDLSQAVFTIVFGMILLAFYNIYFVIMAAILLLLMWLVYKVSGKRGLETSIKESKYKYATAHWLEEIGRVNKGFKMNAGFELHLNRTDDVVNGYLEAREKHFKILVGQFSQFVGIKVFLVAGLLFAGSILVFEEQMNIGQFVAAEIIIFLIVGAIEKIIASIETVYDVLTGLDKVGHVTDIPLDEDEGSFLINPEKEGISLEASHLSYMFPGDKQKVIDSIDFDVKPSERVLLTGSSGSGKTTLLKLLAGFYYNYTGELNLNDIPIHNYNQDDFHRHIGAYFSTNHLFEGTILNNITMGREISESRIMEVLDVLNLRHFIAEQKHGLNTVIDTDAQRYPRSVIQKLLIARTIIHGPKLLLLEDPLRNVMDEEKNRIIDYIMNKDRTWTVIVVADYGYWKGHVDKVIDLSLLSNKP